MGFWKEWKIGKELIYILYLIFAHKRNREQRGALLPINMQKFTCWNGRKADRWTLGGDFTFPAQETVEIQRECGAVTMAVYSMEWNTVTSIGHIVLIFNFKTVYLLHIWCEARVLIPWLLFWHSDNKSSTFEFDIQPNTAFEIIQRLIGLLSSHFISFRVVSEHQNAFNHSLRSFE